MNNKDSSSSLDRLADFNKACVALDEDCSQDQFVILGSSTHPQHDEVEDVLYDETVLEHQEGPYGNGNGHDNHHHHQRVILGDMSLKGIVFLVVLAVSLGVCAFFLYKFHINNKIIHVDPEQQAAGDDDALRATETTTTTTTETVASSTTTANAESSETKKKTIINNNNNSNQEESSSSPLQTQQQQQQDTADDDEVPDLVVEDSSNNKNNNAASRRSTRIQERQQQPQQQQQQLKHSVVTVVVGVPSTTVPTSSQLTAAATTAVARPKDNDEPDIISLQAAEKVLSMRKLLENRTGETLSLDKVFEQSLDQSRHDEKMRYKVQAEMRHYEFEMSREAFKNDQTQARHDDKMAAKREDNTWLNKIKTCRLEMLQTLMQEFLYTVYVFFAIHVIWHFFRLRQIWTFAGITSALYYSVCGQCTLTDDLIAFQYYEEPPQSYFASYFTSAGYFTSYFPSLSSWSSFSFLELVAPAWLLQDLACTGICGVKIILGVFGAIVTAMIVPVWMAKYMAAGVVAMTMISNVFEWVPFIIGWQYMVGIYFCLGLGCYYYIDHVCKKSQGVLHAIGATPSNVQVTIEVAKLDDVKEALQNHKFVLLGLAVVCFHYSALELERNRQFA